MSLHHNDLTHYSNKSKNKELLGSITTGIVISVGRYNVPWDPWSDLIPVDYKRQETE